MKTLFFIIFSLSVYAQTGTIKGKVIDKETGEALIGANVIITELNIGAATDIDGHFKIYKIPSGIYSLFVAYISYIRLDIDSIKIDSGIELNNIFELQPDSTISEFIIYERPITRIRRSCEPPYDFLKPRGLFIDTLIHINNKNMPLDSVRIK